MHRGLFIALEGSDGSGKGTQFNLLAERLKAVGYDVATYDFPQYDENSSYFVKEYLNGRFGPASEISPYTASLFYALDRYSASEKIRKDLEGGKIVLANRYVGSNMAHQGGKFTNQAEQRGFFVWDDNLEYELLKLPRPDLNILLRVPAEVSYELIQKKGGRSYSSTKLDEHEADMDHLRKSVATFDLLCRLFPRDFKAIDCVKDGNLMDVAQISNLLWSMIKPLLPPDKPKAGHSAVVTLATQDEPKKGHSDDQPDRMSMPLKSASLALRQQIEVMYPGSTVPRSGDWSAYGYQYFTPQGLPKDARQAYKTSMDLLVSLNMRILEKLIDYFHRSPSTKQADTGGVAQLLRPITPLSAIMPFEVVLNKDEVLPLARRLLESDSSEAQWAAKQLYTVAKQIWPQEFAKPLETRESLQPMNAIAARLAPERLAAADDTQMIKLLEAIPRQEFDLIAESVYSYSNLSLDEITEEVSEWPYQQKFESLRLASSQPNILRKVTYKIDIISDQITMTAFADAAGLQDVQVQTRTPRYGFEVPQIFEDANLDDLYNACFDESLKIYSILQTAGTNLITPYAVLLGHKVRWQLNADAENLVKAYNKRPIPYKNLMNRLLETVAEIHPVLWDVLTGSPSDVPQSTNGRSRVKPYHQRHRKTGPNSKKS